MNRGRFIGGAICVAVAVFLAVLALVLPDEDMRFQVGDADIPFLPSIILGVVGVALLATSGGATRDSTGAAPADTTAMAPVGGPPEGVDSSQGASAAGVGGSVSAVDPGGAESAATLSDKALLNKQLERMGWGAFLIMLGGFALVPDDVVPQGLWSIGLGVIWLGLNGARYNKGIRMSGFTTFLGAVLLVSGVLELAGLVDVGGAIFLITLGAYVIAKPAIERRGLFGKAEQD